MSTATSVILLIVLATTACAQNYCTRSSAHTMCKYSASSISRVCANYKSTPRTAADRQALLHAHNALRNRVALGQETRGVTYRQPPAANMRKLVWDSELEAIAQRWANQCQFDHDKDRSTIDGTYSGQNIFWEASTGALPPNSWNKAVQAWYDEVQHRDGSLNIVGYRSTSGPVVGHYTQMAWATSTRVGCASVDYTVMRSGKRWNARLVICNYKPGGNVIGQKMYEYGSAASKCPAGTSKDATYPGLCA